MQPQSEREPSAPPGPDATKGAGVWWPRMPVRTPARSTPRSQATAGRRQLRGWPGRALQGRIPRQRYLTSTR